MTIVNARFYNGLSWILSIESGVQISYFTLANNLHTMIYALYLFIYETVK